MTPEQLEREAAERVRRMGYPDELSDAERWHRFRGDAELVVSAYIDMWKRVRVLDAALREARPYVYNTRMQARAEAQLWRSETAAGVLVRVDAALAGGSDG